MDEEEVEEMDNKKDFDRYYDPSAVAAAVDAGLDEDIAMVDSKSFVSLQGWDSEKIVDYRIDEEEFHKISLLDCGFLTRKPPDPDNDVYDFRELYVTPPDSDVCAIPRVLAPVPQKVFLTKHYRNRRSGDPEFVLDFEEIYVIDSKTNSITRAKVLSERDDPITVIERKELAKTRQDMERHLRKLRGFSVSNWF